MDKTINDLAADKELKLSSKAADVNGTNFWVTNALNDNSVDEDGWLVAGFIDDFSGVSGGERESKTATPINTNQYETIISQGAIKKEDFTLKSYYDFTATEGVNLMRKAFNNAKAVFIKIQVPDGSQTTIVQRGKVSKFAITTEKDGKYMADVTIMKEGDENVKRKFKPAENEINFKIGAGDEEPIVGVTYAKWADKIVCFNSFDVSIQPKKGNVRKIFKFDKDGKCLSKAFQKWSETDGEFIDYTPPAFVAPVDSATVEVLYKGEEIDGTVASTAWATTSKIKITSDPNKGYSIVRAIGFKDETGKEYTFSTKSGSGANAVVTMKKDGAAVCDITVKAKDIFANYNVQNIFKGIGTASQGYCSRGATPMQLELSFSAPAIIASLDLYNGASGQNCGSKNIKFDFNDGHKVVSIPAPSINQHLEATVYGAPEASTTQGKVPCTQPTPGATNIDWRSKTVLFYEKESNIAKPTPMSVRYKYNVDDQGVIGAQIREVFSEMDNAYHYMRA